MLPSPPDPFESAALDALFAQHQTEGLLDRSPWEIRRFTWGETSEPLPSAGQRYSVRLRLSAENGMHTLEVVALHCRDAQSAAFRAFTGSHQHDDRRCAYDEDPQTSRAYVYPDQRAAALAALRWDPDTAIEPFGWLRAFDGTRRYRPDGDPERETLLPDPQPPGPVVQAVQADFDPASDWRLMLPGDRGLAQFNVQSDQHRLQSYDSYYRSMARQLGTKGQHPQIIVYDEAVFFQFKQEQLPPVELPPDAATADETVRRFLQGYKLGRFTP